MTGLPVRIYRNREQVFSCCVVDLIVDPINPYISDILKLHRHVDYYVTADFDSYGIINGDDFSIIIGPSINENATTQQLKKRAFELNVPASQYDQFINQLNSLVRMPLNSIIQILCTMNYVINDEKLSLEDLTLKETAVSSYPGQESQQDSYRGYLVEKTLCEFIRNGDLTGFEEWVRKAPTVRAGKLANDTLRQQKNIFIVSATLFSRSAIEAGMDINDSLRLSDYYIQQCENRESVDSITILQFTMLSDYIRKVAELKSIKTDDYLTKKVYHYIMENLSEPVKTDEIAEYLGLSRSYLSTCFKQKTGYDLKNYILMVKINQAKQLLVESDSNLLSIATYLGFSSSSHFTRVFTSFTGISPSQYRKSALNS